MLQRAAGNAYSWWWASHIRTKQSKWLEQNLQDMEDKVGVVLKLLEEEGDSFAKRAEMYYKKRPELIGFVEESFRAYRALAERYEHMSKELQTANNTIAYVFPEQVQFSMDDEFEASKPKFPKKPPEIPKVANIPEVPKLPKDLKTVFTIAAKKMKAKKATKGLISSKSFKSGLTKPEGLKEIDKLQKQILMLQTEKEFAKSSYEGILAKYLQLEEQICELQHSVCNLQDEFGAGSVIEDEEARSLMASTALRSCQQTLSKLQKKQEKSTQEVAVAQKRINDAQNKLKSLVQHFSPGRSDQEQETNKHEPEKDIADSKDLGEEISSSNQQKQDIQSLQVKIKEYFDVDSNETLTLTDLAEKIDEVVDKVINLETAVSSQTALIQRLRTEAEDLHSQIHTLEDDKATLQNGKDDLSGKLRETEQKLLELQNLTQNVVDQNNDPNTHPLEANFKLQSTKTDEEVRSVKPEENLSKLSEGKTDNEPFVSGVSDRTEESQDAKVVVSHHEVISTEVKLKGQGNIVDQPNEPKKETETKPVAKDENSNNQTIAESNVGVHNGHRETDSEVGVVENTVAPTLEEKIVKQASFKKLHNLATEEMVEKTTTDNDNPDWKQLFMNGMDNREKTLLSEYTTTLRNLKEMKKKLAEEEKKNSLFDVTLQLKELKVANAKKDDQIQNLRQKLSLLQAGLGEEENESEKSARMGSPSKETDINVSLADQAEKMTEIEEKFRASIDEVLEENLDFWFRFSNTYQQIQKFDTETTDLQSECWKLEEKLNSQESTSRKYSLRSDAKPLFKHLREIHAELGVWLEQSALLKDELKGRFASLCEIQEEITNALKESAEDEDFTFTSYQAAKFQGEILNMKQENNKVADELQAGLDHITMLQIEVEKTLAKLNEEFKLSGSKHSQNMQLLHSESRARVPLHSFIFGTKPKKQKQSIFSCVHPILQRRSNGMKSGPL